MIFHYSISSKIILDLKIDNKSESFVFCGLRLVDSTIHKMEARYTKYIFYHVFETVFEDSFRFQTCFVLVFNDDNNDGRLSINFGHFLRQLASETRI